MSHRGGGGDMGDPRPRGGPRPPLAAPPPLRIKRRRTRRERDAAKFGGKAPGGARRWQGAGPPPTRPPLPPWVGSSPLAPPRPVVITQNRLCCHRGLFNCEVKSVNVERLLSPPLPQGGTPPPPAETPPGDTHPSEPPATPCHPASPQIQAGPGGPRDLAEVSGWLRALLGGVPGFRGHDLAGKRRGSILATLRHRHHGLPNLALLLAHRHRLPPGHWCPRIPPPGGGDGVGGGLGEQEQSWGLTPRCSSTPGPLRGMVDRTPPRPGTPSPIFGGNGRRRETPFSWTSGTEEEEAAEEAPAPLFWTPTWRRDPPRHRAPLPHGKTPPRGGVLPSSPLHCTCGGPFLDAESRDHPLPPAPATPQHRHPPRPSTATPTAPQYPDWCRGASPDPPRTPPAWSTEASHRPGRALGWPCAKHHVPQRHRHHHHTRQHHHVIPRYRDDVPQYHNDALWHRDDIPQYRDDAPQHCDNVPQYRDDAPWHRDNIPQYHEDTSRHHDNVPWYRDNMPWHCDNVPQYRDDAPQHRDNVPQHHDDVPWHGDDAPRYHDDAPLRRDNVSQYRDDTLWHYDDMPWHHEDAPRHRGNVRPYRDDGPRHHDDAPRHRGNVPQYRDNVPRHRDDAPRCGPPRPSPPHCCCWPLPKRRHQQRDWEDWRDAAPEPGWLQTLRHLPPLPCFPPPAAPQPDGSPPGSPGWGCPCTGLH